MGVYFDLKFPVFLFFLLVELSDIDELLGIAFHLFSFLGKLFQHLLELVNFMGFYHELVVALHHQLLQNLLFLT